MVFIQVYMSDLDMRKKIANTCHLKLIFKKISHNKRVGLENLLLFSFLSTFILQFLN